MELPGWDWPAVAALATLAIAVITAGVGIATCYFIREGIRAMNKSSDERAADRRQAQATQEADRRQAQTALEEERRRSREELAEWRQAQEAEQRRSREELAEWRRAQEAEQRRAREELAEWRRTQEDWRKADERRHEEAMAALAALIERTGGPRPAALAE